MRKLLIVFVILTIIGVVNGQNIFKYEIRANGGLKIGQNGIKIDSVKKFSDKIYFYSGSDIWSSDTVNGIYALNEDVNDIKEQVSQGLITLYSPLNSGKRSANRTFYGFRKGGDSIFIDGGGVMLGERNRLVSSNAVALGVQSVVTGYMSTSAGTNTIAGSNDSFVAGNENISGTRMYLEGILSKGYDGGGNYILINGNDISGLTGIGSQVSHFKTTVDSLSYDWASRVFWSYPIFWTNQPTRDYPAGSDQRIGPTPLRCTGVSYDSGTGYTKVYYADSLLSLSGGAWITSCRINAVGTGIYVFGKYSNAAGEGSGALGMFNRAYGQSALAVNESNTSSNGQAFSSGYGNTSSGSYSFTGGAYNIASGAGAVAFGEKNSAGTNFSFIVGKEGKSYGQYDFIIGGGKYANVGDNQILKRITKQSQTGVGPFTLGLHQLGTLGVGVDNPYRSFSGITTVTAVQTSSTVGRPGESRTWVIKWNCTMHDKYTVDSVNVALDRLYYTGADLEVGDWLFIAPYTDTTMSTYGSAIGGLASSAPYVIEVGTESGGKWVKVSLSKGGGVRDITGTGAGSVHIFYRGAWFNSAVEYVGGSFYDDSDTVGNGTTTGIRLGNPVLVNHQFYLNIYGLANRTLRWTANSEIIVIGSN